MVKVGNTETGEQIDVTVEAWWDPDHELTQSSVIDSATLSKWWEAFRMEGKKIKFIPVSDPVLIR